MAEPPSGVERRESRDDAVGGTHRAIEAMKDLNGIVCCRVWWQSV